VIHNRALDYLVKHFDITTLKPLVVDIGTAEGQYTSNSYPLIIDYGWHGVLVEPQKEQLEKAKQHHSKHLDRIDFINCAICEHDGTQDLFIHPNDGDGSSTSNHGSSLLPIPGSRSRVEVDCMSYESLVGRVDFNDVGLLSIDAEGYDMKILKGIFEATTCRPQVMILEACYFLSDSDDRQNRKDFLSNDYECIYDDHDQIFINKTL
jgi:FkbM family methyltransferase